MRITGSVCESGGKTMPSGRFINEDGLLVFTVDADKKYEYVIVMDGATGLGKSYCIVANHTPAEWYVKFMMNEMKKIFKKDPSVDLDKVVEKCIVKATKEILKYEKNNNVSLEEYQKPSAGLSLLRTNGETTDIYLIGDTQAIIAYKDGTVSKIYNPNQIALQKLDNSVIRRMSELSIERNCNILDTRTDKEIEDMLSTNRSKKNADCGDGYWVCGTTPGTAKHGTSVSYNNADIKGFILATDGFDFTMLNLDEGQVYDAVLEKGVETIAKMIREKQDKDPMCNLFPRFKKSDDLTVVHLDYML